MVPFRNGKEYTCSYLVVEQIATCAGPASAKFQEKYENKRIVENDNEWDSWKELEETKVLNTQQVQDGDNLYVKYLNGTTCV